MKIFSWLRPTFYDKTLFIGVVVLSLVILATSQASAAITIVQEDFNRADANLTASPTATNGKNWTSILGAKKPYVFQNLGYWDDTGTNPSAYLNLSDNTDNKTTLCIDVWSQQSTTTNANLEFYKNTTRLVRIDFINTEKVRAWTGATTLNVYNYSSFVWYTLCIVQQNSSYYNLTINGNFRGSYKNYNSNTGYINRVWLEGGGGIVDRFDNIEMDVVCNEQLVNITGTWTNISQCYSNSTRQQSRWIYTYDWYGCGETNATNVTQYRWAACNYVCNESVVNETSAWVDAGECLFNSTKLQSRTFHSYDENECGDYEEYTVTQYRYVTCNYTAGGCCYHDEYVILLGLLIVWISCTMWMTRRRASPDVPDYVIAGISVGALAVLAAIDVSDASSTIYLVCCIAAGVIHAVRIVESSTGGRR